MSPEEIIGSENIIKNKSDSNTINSETTNNKENSVTVNQNEVINRITKEISNIMKSSDKNFVGILKF